MISSPHGGSCDSITQFSKLERGWWREISRFSFLASFFVFHFEVHSELSSY